VITAPIPRLPRPAPGDRDRPALQLIEDPRRRVRRGLLAICGTVLVFVLLFGNVVFHNMLVSGQRRLDGISAEVQERRAEQARLRLLVAQLESPERIVSRAERQGMQVPEKTTWVKPPADEPVSSER
jgi:cell division protein FtsL